MKVFFKITLLSLSMAFAAGCGSGGGSAEDELGLKVSRDPHSSSADSLGGAVDSISSTLAPAAVPTNCCTSFVEGIPVGIGMLHAANPNARSQALMLADILAQSCRRHIAITMLVDGTFGSDRDFLGEIVRIATDRGSTLHLYLYLSNGPWQRKYEIVPDDGFGNKLPPEEFRRRIVSDPEFQDEFRALVKWVEPLVSYAGSRGAVVSLFPGLEDNLDQTSARTMEALITGSILSTLVYDLGRNPCGNCYPGNDSSLAPGSFEDQHLGSARAQVRVRDGLVTNDGASFDFPGEDNGAPISFDQLFEFAKASARLNSAFVAWKGEWQGKTVGSDDFVEPNNRTYASPTPEQAALLLKFLQTTF